MGNIPTLTTLRLTLRPINADDWRAYSDFMHTERSRFLGGPLSDRQAWGIFCASHVQWDLFGFGSLMIEESETGTCVGQVGIQSGPLFPESQLGWLVYDGAESKGYAFEAALALRDWARDARKVTTLVSYVDPKNIRSRNLAKRLGAKIDTTAVRQDPRDLVFRHF